MPKKKLDPQVKNLFRAIFPQRGRFYCAVCMKEKPLSERVSFSIRGSKELCQQFLEEEGLGETWVALYCCRSDYKKWSRALQDEGFEVRAKIL